MPLLPIAHRELRVTARKKAASRLRMEVDSKPEEIDELDRKIIQLKIEREALKKEEDKASRERLK